MISANSSAKFQFRFPGSEEWFPGTQATADAVAEHAMTLHSGRSPQGVRRTSELGSLWRATGRGASTFPLVEVAQRVIERERCPYGRTHHNGQLCSACTDS